MKTRKPFNTSSWALVLGATLIATTGLGALGIVWTRVEISKIAESSRNLERDVNENARKLRALNTKRAKTLNPASLKSLVEGRLIKPARSKVIFVRVDDLQKRQEWPLSQLTKIEKTAGNKRLQRLALR